MVERKGKGWIGKENIGGGRGRRRRRCVCVCERERERERERLAITFMCEGGRNLI